MNKVRITYARSGGSGGQNVNSLRGISQEEKNLSPP